ncbi:helix-turn-helix domain-containing protein [Gordonibacter urolithinfaciens]|jgi:transcriptional regulator with XRE-family HTH domain|uniref:Helix-turn-helix domain-containing protein n=1 Tax=Gordonibacter urolithinfaciens TaxID=1335613 RepID=A0A423UM69_9ACTN|nr:helix-turn-helix transcriptional regulator [Gordonibacter urolithinfaciens]MBS6974422.1 helix-turn-helix transcriptional regulator [Eggerthellaceae bacterium]MCB6560458.1 helix-turn-helix transcriptional regulator [Gordonibacter urolithinfaciens]MCB7086025.1 helix-turn-helix transcriptional regulator [Gordonibacter urolithinfaciens]MSA93591.1 helix-turn-helix domain-containing protein [Gordonibacter urolithinfaciens]ROT91088.1 XRE family transcriptional regulator [Gordonibacter urolithinfac
MSTLRVQFGWRIKDLREERGLSQRGFAEKIGMSPSYLADVERGSRNISLDNIKRIADGFDISVAELMEVLRERG